MIFYPSRRNNHTVRRLSSPRPLSSDAGEATHITWMLKSFVMGITLLGLSYWLVQIAGVQYLASLTSATLLAFLLAYVVWCLLHKNRHTRQTSNSPSRIEAGNTSTVGNATEALTPTPPPPFDHHQAYKFHTPLPPRDSSPPPTYEEAVRAMLAMTAPTATNHSPQVYTTPPSSVTASTLSALTISPTSAFTPPSPASPHSVTPSPSVMTPQQSSVFTQRGSPVHSTPSMTALAQSEQPLPALTRQQMSRLPSTHSQQSISALMQQSSAMTQEKPSALLQTPHARALTPRGSSTSLEESNTEALRSSTSTQPFPLTLTSHQSAISMFNSGLRQTEGPSQRFSPTTQTPRFVPMSLSTRSRQQTPPPQPPKSTSVFDLGDVS